MSKDFSTSVLDVPSGGVPSTSNPSIISFTSDPNAGAGIAAPAGSLGMLANGVSSLAYVNAGSPTSWAALSPLAAPLATIAFTGSASDLISGTVPPAFMPALTGDVTSTTGAPTATTIAAGHVTNAMLGSSAPAFSVIGQPTGTAGIPSYIAATTSGQILQRLAGILQFAAPPSAFTTQVISGSIAGTVGADKPDFAIPGDNGSQILFFPYHKSCPSVGLYDFWI